jgi:D-xylose reductase
MEDLVDRGLARRIGVLQLHNSTLASNLVDVSYPPPQHSRSSFILIIPQQHLIRFARDAGMQVTAFSVLGASSYLELNMATDDDVLFDQCRCDANC